LTEEKTTGWRWGINRWLVFGLVGLGIWVSFFVIPPIQPHIQLPAENVTGELFNFAGQPFHLTNTLIATILADIIVLALGFSVWMSTRGGNLVPKGISGAVDGLLEVLYGLTEGTAGKWTKVIFPMFATITMLVLVANWMELIPGVDSIGVFDEHHIPHPELCEFRSDTFLGLHIESIVSGDRECASGVVPFVRVASTDLNFTAAIAVVGVLAIQVVGVWALGFGYFSKFFNTSTLFKVPLFGVIDFAVSLIELVSEFVKVLSFSFRLFGNIFAGSVMLFVIGSLLPTAQVGFLLLEFFVGAVQAIVFGMLMMIFMAQATISHAHDDDHH
jgi:F-type H+-transporting ATPase subunit a